MNYRATIERARELSAESSYKGDSVSPGFYVMILEELQRLNSNIEGLKRTLSSNEADKSDKTEAMFEVEKKWSNSIEELLQERAGKSVRELADELGISKSTASSWRQKFATE